MKQQTEKIRGVNLSGWLALESWVTPGVFSSSGTLDENDLVRVLGKERYGDIVKRHRESFIQETDFIAIAGRGYNAVRIKLPWFVFGEEGPEPGDFIGCIDYVDSALDWAKAANLKVLLCLANTPGDSDVMEWEQGNSYREATLDVLYQLAKRYRAHEAFLGIEVLDRPLTPSKGILSFARPLHRLRNFYRDAYDVIRISAGSNGLVVLSDAAAPSAWGSFMAQRRFRNVWLDCHLYHHAESVRTTAASDVRSLVRESRKAIEHASRSGLPILVGEWSAALPIADSSVTPEGRIALERIYSSEQISAYSSIAGWFFQTWKTAGKLTSWDARIALSSFERTRFGL